MKSEGSEIHPRRIPKGNEIARIRIGLFEGRPVPH
jgi:hypothetical protein